MQYNKNLGLQVSSLAKPLSGALLSPKRPREARRSYRVNFFSSKAIREELAPARIAETAAIVSVALGAIGVLGWWLNIPLLDSFWPGAPQMTVNGAVILVLLGATLWLVLPLPVAGRLDLRYRVGQGLALMATCLGLATVAEHLFAWDAGIDQWLLSDPLAAGRHAIPGRPSYTEALNALGMGLGLALLEVRIWRVWLSEVMAVLTMQVALLALMGHFFGLPELYGSVRPHYGTGMSVQGAAAFFLLGAGLLCVRTERGLTAVLRSQTPGGILARLLMLTPTVVLLMMGLVYMALRRSGTVYQAIGTWALLMTNSLVVTLLVWAVAHALHRVGLERDEAHHTLEDRVQQRTSELTQANAALHMALAEKEILLKEVHHRVKNNLQVICSILSLQSSYVADEYSRGLFEECQNRVKSMGLVHEKLYRTPNLATIDFAQHVRDLASMLVRSYTTASERIRLETDTEPVTVDMDTAIAASLILNELVTNAQKHAFADGRTGTLRVSLRTGESQRISLSVSDDGPGLPAGFDWQKSRSLGLKIVRSLTRQMHGEIRVKPAPGTSFTILFPAATNLNL